MNIRYDDVVHAFADGEDLPVCGTADMPAWEAEATDDPVTCWECKAIVG